MRILYGEVRRLTDVVVPHKRFLKYMRYSGAVDHDSSPVETILIDA